MHEMVCINSIRASSIAARHSEFAAVHCNAGRALTHACSSLSIGTAHRYPRSSFPRNHTLPCLLPSHRGLRGILIVCHGSLGRGFKEHGMSNLLLFHLYPDYLSGLLSDADMEHSTAHCQGREFPANFFQRLPPLSNLSIPLFRCTGVAGKSVRLARTSTPSRFCSTYTKHQTSWPFYR